jgi:SAM-dependent methyltransferase
MKDNMIKQSQSFYVRPPLKVLNGIPVFSIQDRYVKNYIQIAADHVAAMKPENENPFIENNLWFELENSTRTLVRKYVVDGARVLDVGVGLGRVLGPLDNLERYGIDISLDYLQRARDRGFEVVFSRIEDMPYKDSYFDAVVACDVLEHVIDLHACCLQILRVLRPGGVLIVRVPYLDDMEAYLDKNLPYEFIHVRSFDVPSLRILFEKIFELRYQEHSFVAPYLKDALFKIKLLPDSSLAARLAREATDADHPLWILRRVTEISHETFRNWIYHLRDHNPALCKELLPELVEGLEVNIVFLKPS